MWKGLKSILVFLFQLILVGIAILIINITPTGIRDAITAVCVIVVIYIINLKFNKITADLDDRIDDLEQNLAHLEAKMD
tara:strand:- start:329 stop:565 length:237 start_codon:yes stop_codon:yes gene_type:complete